MPTTNNFIIPEFDKSTLTHETVNNEHIIVNTYTLKDKEVFVSRNYIKKMPDGNNVIYKVDSIDYTK